MQKAAVLLLLFPAGAVLGACRSENAELATFQDSASYAIGMNMATSLKRTEADVDLPSLVQGMEDVLGDTETQLTEAEASAVLQTLTTNLEEAAAVKRREQGDENTAAGDTYRTKNAGREGVTTTESGLQYEVLTQGSGPKPQPTDRVRVHYRGTLLDGTEFDSSYKSGEPVTFPLTRVIPGWTEALQLMPVGSKFRIVVPPHLGYGERGSPPVIPSNATLIFEVELLAIEQ